MNESKNNQVNRDFLLELTTEIVAAYAGSNALSSDDLPNLIGEVYDTLSKLAHSPDHGATTTQSPAVPINKSVEDAFIICLEDGKKLKMLKRHLRTRYDLSPDQYRRKWGLPADYPMVAPSYAKKRSRLAKKSGLGRGKKTGK